MQRFVDDDRGYLDWLDHHPDGFVINTRRIPSAAYLMLHRASCGTITGKPARGTTFTGEYAKVCGARNELQEFARHLGGQVQPCGLCLSQRGQPMPAKTPGGKYAPLREHLSGATGTRVRMTFKAVEDLVGRLPESAYRHRAWWGNNDGNVEAKAWLDAGWRVESVNQAVGEVVFTRVTAPAVGHPAADSSKSAAGPLSIDRAVRQLCDLLSESIFTQEEAKRIVRESGVVTATAWWDLDPRSFWEAVLDRAHTGGRTEELFSAAGEVFGANPNWREAKESYLAAREVAGTARRLRTVRNEGPAPVDLTLRERRLQTLKTSQRTAFVSYSQRDERYRQRLDTALAQLRRNELITTWHDRMILPGQEWGREIDKNLDNADIVLLLVSPDFIASEYAYGREMVRALERHESGSAAVIPIILRPCDWKNSPLNSLEALPSKGRAVSSWSNRDEAWLDVTQGLRRLISE